MSWQRPNIGSRVTREGHARFWERPEVRFLRATRQPFIPLIVRRRADRSLHALVAKRAEILFSGSLRPRSGSNSSVPSWFISTRCSACSVPTSRPKDSRFDIAAQPNLRFRARRTDETDLRWFRERGMVTSFEVAVDAMRDKGLDPDNDKPTRTE